MSQVTIYLEDDTLAAAKQAAARSQMSLSKWFAQFADQEKNRSKQSLSAFLTELNRVHGHEDDDSLDFLLDPATRDADLGPERPLEPF